MSDSRAAAVKMTRVDKAAILLLTLGETDAAQVLRHMGPKEVQRVGVAMAQMRNVHREQVEQVMSEFVDVIGDQTGVGIGSDGYIRKMLTQALGEDKANGLIDRILLGGNTSGLDSLKWMEPRAVADVIRYEHPQIQAIVVAYLDADRSACVFAEHRTASGTEGTEPDPGEAVLRQRQHVAHHPGWYQARRGHHELPRQLNRGPAHGCHP
jgi:flagellar motor switch protein FliG